LKKKYTSLVVNHEDLTQQYLDLKEKYLQLQKEYHEVREELDLVREQLKVLLESFGDIDKKYADLKIEHSQAIIDLRTKKRKVEELLVLIDHLERKLIALSNLSVEELRKLIEDIDWIKNHLSQILKEFHLAAQHQLLQEISGEISREGLDVEIDHKNSVLRLTEDTVQFSFASDDERYRAHYDNTRKALGTLEKIADVLATVLPCYAGAAASGCSSLYVGTLKSVLIEGHSDKGSIGGGWFGGHQNQYHSVLRAMTVYQDMVQKNNLLSDLVNSDGNKLFAVAGYGTDRPLPGHEDTESDTANRRIELRFIMTPPKLDPEIMLRIEKLGVK
jgi:chemotaxis protein MotB